MTVPLKIHQSFSHTSSAQLQPQIWPLQRSPASEIERISLENHIGSVLVLSEDNEILYITESLQQRLKESGKIDAKGKLIAEEMLLIGGMLKQCREQLPHQSWSVEFDILNKETVSLHIRSRWLKLERRDSPCILMVVEDRQQLIQDMVRDEAQDWGLTDREQEVWLLSQDGYTYRQIAEELYITINTVKKHRRSIHAKRRAYTQAE